MARAADGVARLQKAYADLAARGEMVVQANRNIQRSAEAVGRIQHVTGGAGVNPAALGGRGVGNWFNAGQIGEAGKRFEELGRRVGNTRIAYMQLGSILPNVSSSIMAGVSPVRAIAVQLPDLVQGIGFLGIGLKVLGGGLLALTPLLISGAFAWSAYSAKLEEARTKSELLGQTQRLAAENMKVLNEALDKRKVSRSDYDFIKGNLEKATPDSLKAAQIEMRRLGISRSQFEAEEKLGALRQEMRVAMMDSITAEEVKVEENYRDRVAQIEELASKSVGASKNREAALKEAREERLSGLAAVQAKRDEIEATKLLQQMEDQLSDLKLANGDRVTGAAQEQFEIEQWYYNELFQTQVIGQQRLDELMSAAHRRRVENMQLETEAVKRLAQQKADAEAQLAQARLAGERRGISSDPTMSEAEKARLILPLLAQERQHIAAMVELNERRVSDPATSMEAQLDAQRQLVALRQQDVELAMQAQELSKQGSIVYQMDVALARIENQWGTWAQQLATNFADVFNSAISTISNGITGLIMGTMSWGQALQQIGTSILTNVVQAIVQMGVRWIATKILMATVGKAIEAAALGAAAAMAAGYSAIWAGPATLATIATFGAAAAAAPGLIALSKAVTLATSLPAFAEGGRPPVGKVSLVGEEGPELFVADTAGTIIPARESARIMESSGSTQGSAQKLSKNEIAIGILDSRQGIREFLESNIGKQIIVKHLQEGRLGMGLDT